MPQTRVDEVAHRLLYVELVRSDQEQGLMPPTLSSFSIPKTTKAAFGPALVIPELVAKPLQARRWIGRIVVVSRDVQEEIARECGASPSQALR